MLHAALLPDISSSIKAIGAYGTVASRGASRPFCTPRAPTRESHRMHRVGVGGGGLGWGVGANGLLPAQPSPLTVQAPGGWIRSALDWLPLSLKPLAQAALREVLVLDDVNHRLGRRVEARSVVRR